MSVAADEMVEVKAGAAAVRLIRGDLTLLAADAIVFYAREDLQLGSGFGTAIQVRGGDSIKKELAVVGRVAMGEAVVTKAGNLKAAWLIHACGPKFQEPDAEAKLARCVASALRAAAGRGARSIALPPMGAGFYGVPLDVCARVMVDALRDPPSPIEEVILCAADRREFDAFKKALPRLEGAQPHA